MRLWSKWTKNEKIPKANELIGWRVRIGGVHASPTWPELRTRRSGMTCVIRNQKKKKKNPRTNAGSTEVPQHQRIPHILDKR